LNKLTIDTPRLLGAWFLIVVMTSLLSGAPLNSALGSDSTADVLRNAAANAGTVRVSLVIAMLNCAGIVALATMLYTVLAPHGKAMAMAGFGLWLGEAFFYAVSFAGATGLIRVGEEFIRAGAPAGSLYLALGDFLYRDVYGLAGTALMFFYCAGGFLFYYLMFVSRTIPRLLSAFGLTAVGVAMVAVVLELLGYGNLMVLMMPIGLFEIATGLWLLIRGAGSTPLPEAAG
jgi:hypothetical protein